VIDNGCRFFAVVEPFYLNLFDEDSFVDGIRLWGKAVFV
jgi:hypothetical protein